VEQLNDPRDLVMAFSPLVLGVIGLFRSVVGLRRRDQVVRQATAERDLLFAKLEQARSHLEQVADLSGVAGWDVELPSRSCKLSPAAVKMLGIASEPESLEAFLSNFTPESGAAFQVALRDARRFGRTADVDAQMNTHGDAPRWIRLVGTVVDDTQGASRFVGAMQDLSERIAALGRSRQEEVNNALARLSSRAAAEFKKDLNDPTSQARIDSDIKAATEFHVSSTPTFIVRNVKGEFSQGVGGKELQEILAKNGIKL
jgi:PAS domain-containing protein